MADTVVREIPLAQLVVHKGNPRQDVGDVSELAASIRTSGVLEPLIAVAQNGHFAVVAGSRRLAAAKLAKIATVPVVVREMSEPDIAAAALIENIQRQDLSPLEEARAYREWLTLTGKQQKELAEKVGRAPSTIANALRLLDAPKPIMAALRAGDITAAHARIALSVPAEVVSSLPLKKGTTVDELEAAARKIRKTHEATSRVRNAVDEAKAAGKVVAWPDAQTYWFGEQHMTLRVALGPSPAKPEGAITGDVDVKGTYGIEGKVELHDKVCDCRAVGPVLTGYDERLDMRRVCISPAGWKKYTAELLKKAPKSRIYSSSLRTKKQTPAQRENARKAKEKQADQEAARALDVHVDVPYSVNDRGRGATTIDKKLLRGGPAGENARLALWAFTARDIWNADGGRAALWQRIARMPITKVRGLLAQHAAAKALELLMSRKDERQRLYELVYPHYGIEVPEPKKPKAKKAAKRG